jgi:asparagine synthetase A
MTACYTPGSHPVKPGDDVPVSPAQQQLDKYQARWQQQNIQKYTYIFQRGCYCPREYTRPVKLKVKNQQVVRAKFVDTGELLPANLQGNKQTVTDLFNLIQRAIDKNAFRITAEYDEQYGYPTSISIDYDERIADEEVYISAKRLKVR